ncbi:MAG TPA: ABC transporter permease subunit, partial [Thermoanaerobaculia bacterium]
SLYLPAVFPYLVTGWVTAAGGAWNASIVAEFFTFKGQVLTTNGLGAQISIAAEHADFPALAASVILMATIVVLFNRTVWRKMYALAEERFSLSK